MKAPASLPGTWELLSRIDVTDAGAQQVEPSLGDDPVALLIYDRAGHFAAQFMKRDHISVGASDTAGRGANNTRAVGGYDAYFGTFPSMTPPIWSPPCQRGQGYVESPDPPDGGEDP